MMMLLRGNVGGSYVHDAAGVDVEFDFDLRYAARRRRDAFERELAESLVVRRVGPLALQHLDLHLRLVVGRRREHLLLLRGDRGVPHDYRRGHTAQSFDAECQRRHVKEDQVVKLFWSRLFLFF